MDTACLSGAGVPEWGHGAERVRYPPRAGNGCRAVAKSGDAASPAPAKETAERQPPGRAMTNQPPKGQQNTIRQEYKKIPRRKPEENNITIGLELQTFDISVLEPSDLLRGRLLERITQNLDTADP